MTLRVTEALKKLGLRHLVGGSLASSLHGVPRSTNDADIVAEIPADRVEDLVGELGSEFYVDAGAIEEAIQRGASFNVIHLATVFKVDVFVLRDDPFSQEEMNRRQEHRLSADAGASAFFATAEDTILQKLDWYRKRGGGSDRQWGDVQGVLKVSGGKLDRAYLLRWAASIDVLSLLERALEEAGS